MKKYRSHIIIFIIAVFAIYNSVYFKSLDEVVASRESSQFNASVYTEEFWEALTSKLDQATHLESLAEMLKKDPGTAFRDYSNALGIGNVRFFLVQSTAVIASIEEDHMLLMISPGLTIKLATDYIFGNAVRDASGLIDVNEFTNTMYFNEVSAKINEHITREVLPPFVSRVHLGDRIYFVGAIELHKVFYDLEQIEVVPVHLEIISSADGS